MTDWAAHVSPLGLSPAAAEHASDMFSRVDRCHHDMTGSSETRAWWVPGRIEVLGKHTDYGGGRSLLCAVERGFHAVASPRADRAINITDGSTGATLHVALDANTPPRPGHWTDYPISVARRIARDFPAAKVGMDLVVQSSLPPASGLSSSSALLIACFLPLAAFNELHDSAVWHANIPTDDAMAEYLGAVENGRAFAAFPADHGVGTQGGSEDHVAILRSTQGELAQYRFIPATDEDRVALPAGWEFVVAMSGVHAAKGAAMQARYNALSEQLRQLLALWRQQTGREDPSLLAALSSRPGAGDDLDRWVGDSHGDRQVSLRRRLEQFREETEVIIPGVVQCLRHRDMPAAGPLIDRSQQLAEGTLGNQVGETAYLARKAREFGAAAASAFGAGFGGSVWAAVRIEEAESFRDRWFDDYVGSFPQHRHRAVAFRSAAGPPAHEVCR